MCIFENENNHKCENNSQKKYGDFCKKHKREYLVENDKIIYERFTGNSADYLKNDIMKTIHSNDKNLKKFLKKELFEKVNERFITLKKYEDDVKKIKLIQSQYQKVKVYKDIKLRGEGFVDRTLCNNDTDFFSYETINEIDDKYFFSYKDSKNFHWFFDIRSFDKLLEMNQGNPYNRESFSDEVIVRAKEIIDTLKLSDSFEAVDKTIVRDRRQSIKQKTVDLFSQIENFGYECHIKWFQSLNVLKLKRLYRNLEDIWNYRLQLSHQVKMNIAPPNGVVFDVPIQQVMQYNNKEDLQDILLNEVNKFNNAITESDKKLGFMYFIIGLGGVCQDCLTSHPWLMYI